jgi:hypothetical protein
LHLSLEISRIRCAGFIAVTPVAAR